MPTLIIFCSFLKPSVPTILAKYIPGLILDISQCTSFIEFCDEEISIEKFSTKKPAISKILIFSDSASPTLILKIILLTII